MGLYENIKKACSERGISINKLELELELPRSSISKYNKNSPSINKVQKIADFLGISVEYLMTGNKPEIPEYDKDTMELIMLYSKLNKEQKTAVINMMRSFALSN